MAILVFDTETTGLPDMKMMGSNNQPHICQLAALLCDNAGAIKAGMNFIIKPDGWVIPDNLAALHGITTEIAMQYGISIKGALSIFARMAACANTLVAHNIKFDAFMLNIEVDRTGMSLVLPGSLGCTQTLSHELVKCPPTQKMLDCGMRGYKTPSLKETYRHFFGRDFDRAHDAAADVQACKEIYFHLKTLKALA